MKEPQRIKLTDSPTNKNVKLTPLPSTKQYPEVMEDDIYTIQILKNEDNKQNNSEGISELESL